MFIDTFSRLKPILRAGSRLRVLKWVAAIAVVLYVAGFAVLVTAQRTMIYHNGAERFDPADRWVPEMREQVVTAPDGVELVLWTTDKGPHAPVIVYFHGNAGVLGHRAGRFRQMLDRGWGVVGVGLRGGSGSGGRPSEEGHGIDARAVYDALPDLLGREVDPTMIVLYGESLGTGIAVTLATQRQVGAVILETPYAAMDDLAQILFPIYPVKALGLVQDRFRSIDRIDRINAPLLVMHGTWDALIPIGEAQRLFDRAKDPKWYHWFGRGQHYDLWRRGALDVMAKFIDRYY